MRIDRIRGQSHLIAEFFAIIVAVLIALLIDEWRADRAQWEEEIEVVTRLLDDIKATNNSRIQQGLRAYESREQGLLLLTDVLTSPNRSFPDSLSIVDFLSDLGRDPMPDFATATFDDLRSSGNTGLIGNRRVRGVLIRYFRNLEQAMTYNRGEAVWEELDAMLESFVPYAAWRAGEERLWTGDDDEGSTTDAEPIIGNMRASPRVIEQLDVALRESYKGLRGMRNLGLGNQDVSETVDEYLAELLAR